ncbi:hypothetical protein ACP93_16985 [Xanthomonas sp. NCPPB 1128]|uniref:hypothetical protein n=1 Tax=Xanthomonas sp. NCPPB 1128 TaxID=1775876 RepID=UPI00065AD9DF|nr:hypothetical protein [Xanthomonas sp. NCPPB 1128]KMM74375.1 hypothetical protein ACP93_16985 [Xanthomonas sp. NCPPB 1128]
MSPHLGALRRDIEAALALCDATRFSLPADFFETAFAQRYPLPKEVDRDASFLQSLTATLWTPASGHFPFHLPLCERLVALPTTFKQILQWLHGFSVHAERLLQAADGTTAPLQAFPFLQLLRQWQGFLLLNGGVLKQHGARYVLDDALDGAEQGLPQDGAIDSAFVRAHWPLTPAGAEGDPALVLRSLPVRTPWVFVLPRPSWLMQQSLASYDAFMQHLAQPSRLQRLARANHLQQCWVGRDGTVLKARGSAATD